MAHARIVAAAGGARCGERHHMPSRYTCSIAQVLRRLLSNMVMDGLHLGSLLLVRQKRVGVAHVVNVFVLAPVIVSFASLSDDPSHDSTVTHTHSDTHPSSISMPQTQVA